jgi:hypothetical protein
MTRSLLFPFFTFPFFTQATLRGLGLPLTLPEQLAKQLVPREAMMCGYARQNSGECAKFQGVMVGKGDVVFAMNRAGQPNVATGLAGGA